MKNLGIFQILCGQIMISDPCYKVGTWCQKAIPALNGNWSGEIEYDESGHYVASLAAYHENYHATNTAKVEDYDDLGVDSGQLGFFDLIKYRDDTLLEVLSANLADPPLCPEEPWYSLCCDKTLSETKAGVIPFGVVSNSGYGDGGYSAEVDYNANGEAIGIRVIFIP